ncbi:hypothetical protein DNTS_030447 [Danionella cerebrum]|uniref:PX domain-containing protein n=1 Tax=Danionella cerebrum TaxID=2873325 RepID=A0A553MLX0_9TELE|nr:hypothetical protein DNTS_030447 [Danionella translucida]
MSDGLITNRFLRNEATGIDLHVPVYQEIRGPAMTGHVEYQIVVVTRLSSFKSTKHKTEDILQFAVPKTYSEIEKIYCSIKTKYPSINLPSMPRKALFVSETDLCKRRVAFDELFKFLSKDPTLANCPELLKFLGANTLSVDVNCTNKPQHFNKDTEDGLDFFENHETSNLTMTVKVSEQSGDLLQPSDEEEFLDPLGNERLKKSSEARKVISVENRVLKPKPMTLFVDDTDLFVPVAKGDMVLFESMDSQSINPTLASTTNKVKSAEPKLEEDFDELFRVEVELDKLLSVSKTKGIPDKAVRPKPKVKAKPVALQNADLRRPEAMNQMDILQYIQKNDKAVCEDLELFPDEYFLK